MRVCVFVDGENFRHSIVELFKGQFHKEEYLPKNADWTNLFERIVYAAVGPTGERLRTYWYVIKSLDFYPYHFPNPIKEHGILLNLLCKHDLYKKELNTLQEPQLSLRMTAMLKELQTRKDIMTERFNVWTGIQDGIAQHHKAIEFRRAGAMKCDLFVNELGREKAVDVKLATDMITLCDIYDVAVIVSGDQDYVPAVEVIKDYGKQVVSVAFLTRSGQLLPGGARRLNQITDWNHELQYQPLGEMLHLINPLPGAPIQPQGQTPKQTRS